MTSWQKLRDEAAQCTRCDLHRRATQTVFGEGRTGVSIMLVGEQPGDQEDKQGRPFVGPAGRILDRALDEAGIDRDDMYVTNAVKHFKWTERGKRRIHQRPNGTEIRACGFWLEAELGAVRPRLVVLLGATYTWSDWAQALGWSGFGNLIGGIGLVTSLRLLQTPHRVAEERAEQG